MPERKASASDDGPVGDRLQPSLLDRLSDDDPASKSESLDTAAVTRTRLRRVVLRDLAWLFNATNLESEIDFEGHEHARASTINYGIDALAGQLLSDVDFADIDHALRESILKFEPRLLPDTVQVRSVVTEDLLARHNMLAFEIRAKLWSIPYPLELLLRSTVDLESGEVVLQDQGAPG